MNALQDEGRDQSKTSAAIKWGKKQLSSFRTEVRKKVYIYMYTLYSRYNSKLIPTFIGAGHNTVRSLPKAEYKGALPLHHEVHEGSQ